MRTEVEWDVFVLDLLSYQWKMSDTSGTDSKNVQWVDMKEIHNVCGFKTICNVEWVGIGKMYRQSIHNV